MADDPKTTTWGEEAFFSESKGLHMVSDGGVTPTQNAVSSSGNDQAIKDLEDFDG